MTIESYISKKYSSIAKYLRMTQKKKYFYNKYYSIILYPNICHFLRCHFV